MIMAIVDMLRSPLRLLRGLLSPLPLVGLGGLAPRITPTPVVTATAAEATPTAPGTLAKGLPFPRKTMKFFMRTGLLASS